MGCFCGGKRMPVHKKGGILITGASTGMGRNAAIHLAQKGYTVFAGVRSKESAATLIQMCPDLMPVMLDVRDDESIEECMKTVKETLSERNEKLVGLFNNAGIGKGMPTELVDIEEAKEVMDVNYLGVIRMYKACVPLLREAGPGTRILNTSSIAGLMSTQGGSVYCASKFTVEAISSASRLELNHFGIFVCTLNPGMVSTEIKNKLEVDYPELTQEQKDLYPGFFAAMKDVKKMLQRAEDVSVTTKAVLDAFTSSKPRRQYIVSNVDGIPAGFMVFLNRWLPKSVYEKSLDMEGHTAKKQAKRAARENGENGTSSK